MFALFSSVIVITGFTTPKVKKQSLLPFHWILEVKYHSGWFLSKERRSISYRSSNSRVKRRGRKSSSITSLSLIPELFTCVPLYCHPIVFSLWRCPTWPLSCLSNQSLMVSAIGQICRCKPRALPPLDNSWADPLLESRCCATVLQNTQPVPRFSNSAILVSVRLTIVRAPYEVDWLKACCTLSSN